MSDTPQQITFAELMTRIEDDAVPIESIKPYLIRVPGPDGRIEPQFQPNPSRVTGLDSGLEGSLVVGGLNRAERRRRHRAYRRRIGAAPNTTRIVSEGDSWFQYPLLLEDIIDHLMLIEDFAVFSLDAAGDTLGQIIEQNEIIQAIDAERAAALLLSAGGNDLFAAGHIAELLEEVRPDTPVRKLVGARFDAFVTRIIGDYRDLLLKVRAAHPQVVIFIHGYSAAFPRMDRWIGLPLKRKGISAPEMQHAIVREMVTRFNAAQKRMAAEAVFEGKVVHVDLSGLGPAAEEWYDEIHMDSAANSQAANLFAEALRRHLPAGGLESGAAGEPATAEPVAAVSAHARDLVRLDEDMLLAELDRRIRLVELDPDAGALPSADLLVLTGGLESGVSGDGRLARRLVRRWERELFDLVCGTDEDDKKDRDDLRDALGIGEAALVGAVSAWLVTGPLGVPALLAGVLAAILVKRFGGATAEVACAAWKERVDARA